MSNEQIWIIMPVYNESPEVYKPLISALFTKRYHVVVVDDGSSKPVTKVSEEIILRHPQNLGQGAALSTGMQYVMQQKPTCIVHMDSDGQHQVADIEAMIHPIATDEADIVIGTRFQSKASIQSIPVLRRWTLRIARILNSWFTGKHLSDAHNGFRAMKPLCLPYFLHLIPGREHASQVVFIANQRRWRIKEVPVHIQYELSGKSQRIALVELLILFVSLCRYRLNGYKFHHPELIRMQSMALEKANS